MRDSVPLGPDLRAKVAYCEARLILEADFAEIRPVVFVSPFKTHDKQKNSY